MTLFRVSPSPPPPKQTKIQMTPNVCHFLQDSLAESRRKKTNVMCNIYPELWEVYHKKSLPKRQKCREKVPKKRQVVKKLFQLDFWVVLLAVPKSRPKKKGVDTLSLTHTDSWYLPGCAIHLQVLFAFSFRERFSAHNLVETFPTKMLLPCTEIMPHAIDGASMFIACLSRLKSQSQVKKRSVPFPAVGPGGPPKKEPELVGVNPHI